MSKPTPYYVDGYTLPDQELTVVPPPVYPFSKNPTPDIYTKTQDRIYNVLPILYRPRIANRTTWTNLLTSSEVFASVWTANAVTPTDNSVVAPDGNTTMAQLLETAATAEHSVSRSLTLTAAASAISIFAASGLNRDWIRIKFVDSGATVYTCFFNITAGYVGAASNCTGQITPMTNGRFRCSILLTPAAGAGALTHNISTDGTTANISYAGNTARGVYVWGAEAKTAATPGPYIGTTGTTRTILAPDQEVVINVNARQSDPLAYLADETDPKVITSAFSEITRTFARIPLPQTVYSSMAITKPAVPNQSTGTQIFFKQGTSSDIPAGIGNGMYYSGYLFSPENIFYGPLQTASITPAVAVTAGQFTLNYRGSVTGNLNYNDAIATILTALNGLAAVIADGLTYSIAAGSATLLVSTGELILQNSVGATAFRIVMNSAGFSPSGATVTFTYIASPTQQIINTATYANIVSHGFNPSLPLINAPSTVATSGNNIVIAQPRITGLGAGSWVVVDSNTLALSTNVSPGITNALFAQSLRSYTPGPDRVGCKLVTSFYLPGVTTGITTPADIPIPAPLINDTDFLAAVLANTSGYLNYDADPLTPWLGPIFEQTQKQINMADV